MSRPRVQSGDWGSPHRGGAFASLLDRFRSPARFVREPPGWDEWSHALGDGWPGPDGSTASLDDIMGVRVGITSTLHVHSTLPANRHDYWYHLGRTYQLPSEYRRAADRDYRVACIARVRAYLVGWRVPVGAARAWVRWGALRLFGWRAWNRPPDYS